MAIILIIIEGSTTKLDIEIFGNNNIWIIMGNYYPFYSKFEILSACDMGFIIFAHTPCYK